MSSLIVIQNYSVILLNSTAVWVIWQTHQIPDILHYTVYYNKSSDTGMKNFSHNNGVIGGLVPNSANYQFIISVIIEINGVIHDVTQTHLIDPGIIIFKSCEQLIMLIPNIFN